MAAPPAVPEALGSISQIEDSLRTSLLVYFSVVVQRGRYKHTSCRDELEAHKALARLPEHNLSLPGAPLLRVTHAAWGAPSCSHQHSFPDTHPLQALIYTSRKQQLLPASCSCLWISLASPILIELSFTGHRSAVNQAAPSLAHFLWWGQRLQAALSPTPGATYPALQLRPTSPCVPRTRCS